MRIKRLILGIMFLSFMTTILSSWTTIAQTITAFNLRVEYMENPLGVDISDPRFSWNLNNETRGTFQSAFQIQLAEEVENLKETGIKLWDTGKTLSNKSVNINYEGKPLEPGKTYYWRIRAWNEKDNVGNWSKIAIFHVGPMNNDDWKGKWIGTTDKSISAPLLRKEFQITKPIEKAYAYIVGLGYYELYLNGEKVGDHVLDPGTTNYDKRVLYETYDVTSYLKENRNAVGVWLGNGWFRHRRPEPYSSNLELLFQLQIKHTDGTTSTIVSNKEWKISDSPIVENSVFDGEVYDARKELPGWTHSNFDDSDWVNANEVIAPKERIIDSQLLDPIKVVKTLRPVRMWEPVKDVFVYDFGQNVTGWPRLRVLGAQGMKVILRTSPTSTYDVALMKDLPLKGLVDTIDVTPNRSAKARNIYILKGDKNIEEYEPRFTYQGFRYVQIEGFPGRPDLTSIDARVVHSSVNQTGEFECSNTLLNQIHQNIIWGQVGNLFSIPTDTPHRDERLGWLGDAHLIAEEAIYNFDMASFYTKWLRDIKDCQLPDGSVLDYVPHAPSHRVGTPAWQVAYPLIVYYLYKYYNDKRIIEEHFTSLVKWMQYMSSISDNFIIKQGRGDWVPPRLGYEPNDDSIPITSTGYYYESALIMVQLSDVLGDEQYKSTFLKLSQDIKQAFNETFLDTENFIYGTGSQTSMAFPLYIDIVPEDFKKEVANNLSKQIIFNDKTLLTTGIIGTKALVQALPKNGMSELLYELTAHTEFPGWGYMIAKGATTLWERWGGYRYFDATMNSLNHIMFGSITEFFYKNLAGIEPSLPGYKEITISPQLIEDLTYASATVQTMYGEVRSKWKKQGYSIIFDINIPVNTTAKLVLPKNTFIENVKLKESDIIIWEKGQLKSQVNGIESVQELIDCFEVTVMSGSYNFILLHSQ